MNSLCINEENNFSYDNSFLEKLNLKEKTAIQRQIEDFFKSFDTNKGYNFLEELLYLNDKENSLKNKTKIS